MTHGQADMLSYISRYLVAPLWAAKEGSPYLGLLKDFKKTPYRSSEDIAADQLSRLKKLLTHAFENAPYYKELFQENGIEVDNIRSLQDLQSVPLLTKDILRQRQQDILVSNAKRDSLVRMKTSGSTGVSLELYMDEASQQWKRACALRHNEWSGWRHGERCGAVWGNPEYTLNWRTRLRNTLLDRMFFSTP